MNIADMLDRNNVFFPEREAIIYAGRTITYRDFWENVKRAANAFQGLGVGRGDKVAVFLTNCPEFIFTYYACQSFGAVCVSISSMSKADEVEYMVNDSEAVLLVSEKALSGELPSRTATPGLRNIVLTDGVGGDREWSELLLGAKAQGKTVSTLREDPAAIIYTSGTTGKPKGVVLTHGNIVSNTNAVKFMTGLKPTDRRICFLPIYHSFGQNFIFNAAVQAGCTLVLHKKFEMEPVLESLIANKVTRWYAVPPVYIMMLNHPDRARVDEAMRNVTYCFSAASTLPVEVAVKWKERFGLDVMEGYGLTETSPFATYNHELKHKTGSVGTAINDVEVIIADSDLNELPRGETGEILIRGPNVMKGYYKRAEDTAATIVNGYVRSGDIGYMDEEGYVFIVDRLKDMINAAGLKIWPREVEEILYTHPNVREAAVIGVPHEVYGESVKAVISLKNPGATEAQELIDLCRAKLADYKVPRTVEFVADLPKSPTGKILKREIRVQSGK